MGSCGGSCVGGVFLCELEDRFAAFDERRAYLLAHGRFFSEHLEQGTLLSQPVFALAQLMHAMGVRPLTVGTPPGNGSIGSFAS